MKQKTLLGAIMIATFLTGCTAPEAHTAEESNQSFSVITEEEAKQIALSHAGLTADQVTFIKSRKDRNDGLINYDIEFYTGDHKEYDYEIDPYTGKILEWDMDNDR